MKIDLKISYKCIKTSIIYWVPIICQLLYGNRLYSSLTNTTGYSADKENEGQDRMSNSGIWWHNGVITVNNNFLYI